ncbi:MAG TPA: metalloregulator ArsR/SmtB family transcription factor [Caldimonas sp.]|nr:metalloregulator ArsR/SmtB family transcription factor [Caldimonas sp.]
MLQAIDARKSRGAARAGKAAAAAGGEPTRATGKAVTEPTGGATAATDEMGEVFESVARYFLVLAEPARLRILHAVCQGERTVGEIVAETGLTQSNASRHLNMMFHLGALRRRRDGAQVFYRVADSTLTDVCRAVCVRVSSELDEKTGLRTGVHGLIERLR